jgi:DNA polymerase III epsilon subunit-like protein
MTYKEFKGIVKAKPYLLKMGKGLISKRYNIPKSFVENARKEFSSNTPSEGNMTTSKILILDIETSPMKAYVWKRWKENISLDQTISEWFMISWSAKWLNSSEIMGEVLTSEEAINEDDFRIVKSLWLLLDEADIVIAHNGSRFDIPKINSRFIINGFPPPKPYKQIDTLITAKKVFGFSSNKLDALATYFNIPNKIETDFELWKKSIEGDKEALSYMLKYNKQDVIILEKVYLKLRPWIYKHPNINSINGIDKCPFCGSTKATLQDKNYNLQVNSYPLYRCDDCHGFYRGTNKVEKYTNTKSV